VNYDTGHQFALGQQTAQTGKHLLYQVTRWSRTHYQNLLVRARRIANKVSLSPSHWIARALLVIIPVLLLLNLRRLGRAIQKIMLTARPDRSPRMAASLWYEKMVRKVGRRGWRKSGSQTPVEFAKSIQDDQLRNSVLQFTQRYEGARFGDSPEDARQLPELYAEVINKKH